MAEGEERTFSVTFPEDYGEEDLAGQPVTFSVTLRELRERRLPDVDDDLAQAVGPYDDLAALRADLRERMRRNGLDRARHVFADRIIEYATANATVALPDLLVDREVDVMLDELKVRLSEQGIGYEDYLRVTERDEAGLRAEYREGAAHRVKVLLVLGAIADREGVVVPDQAVEAEVARVRGREGGGSSRLSSYLDSERGRAYIRSQLRRSQTVESIIDRWIDAHPEFAQVQHVHGVAAADRIDEAMDDAEDEAEDEAIEAMLETEELAEGVSR
jgi:trigger factor